jgi:type VI secretion system protein ImpH
MAGKGGRENRALETLERLSRAPERHELFQALRRLECAFRERSRFGEGMRAAEEPVRLSQDPIMSFASSAIVSFTQDKNTVPRLTNNAFGMFGPNGPLPLHLTEYARDRKRNCSDPTMARFLDLFHHRLISLFYRAFANGEPTVQFDRPDSDRFATYLGSLIGLGMPSLCNRDFISDRTKLYFAGHFVLQNRNVDGLKSLLNDSLRIPVDVEQFVGEWTNLPKDVCWRLGSNAMLGKDTILGSRCWLCDSKIRITLGPISRIEFMKLLPGGKALRRLSGLVRAYLGDTIAWDLRLVLDKTDWKPMKLERLRLGWDTWIGARPPKKGLPQILFNPSRKTRLAPRKPDSNARACA